MNLFRFLLCFLNLFALVAGSLFPTRQQVELEFETWRRTFNIEFHNAIEFVHRLNIFEGNHLRIWAHNLNSSQPYQLGHNQFSHLTSDEFGQRFSPWKPIEPLVLNTNRYLRVNVDLPPQVDWVSQGAVTNVKNQGQCGSCWSFSATGALEGAYFLKHGELPSFSEQQLVDCDTRSAGCGGGLMDNAFTYVQNHGLAAESEYPYKAVQGVCKSAALAIPPQTVRGMVDLPPGDEGALANAVASQPVSVAIQANQFAFQFYKSGVLTGECGRELDHGVLVVGYGLQGGNVPYWKIKNSWGPGWGEQGFIRIHKGSNKCGVADAASFPLL